MANLLNEKTLEPTTAETGKAKIDEMVRRIVERFSPKSVILFGSHARDTATRDSDVDLLIVMENGVSKRQTTIEAYRLLAGTGLPKDIVITTPEEIRQHQNIAGTLIRNALRDGVTLYEANA